MNDAGQVRSTTEQQMLDAARRVLTKHSGEADRLRLEFKEPELLVFQAVDSPDYTSEISIYVWSDEDVFDVLEFFVFHRGQQPASITEVTEWLEAAVIDVLREKETGIRGT